MDKTVAWQPSGDYTDIRYETAEGIAKITIDRPEVRNAFRPLDGEGADPGVRRRLATIRAIGVVVLTGEGPDAFCSGGDQKIRGDDGYVDEQGIGRLNVLDLQIQIRRMPKPVVAMVAGYAIGGGHVLHVCCDLTIAADNARFGQTGPARRLVRRRLRHQPARAADRREAREGDLVPLPAVRRRDGARVGLVNAVVPLDDLEDETVAWCREMLAHVPARAAAAEGRRATPAPTASRACSSSPATRRSSTT